jgi:hypothetical protein
MMRLWMTSYARPTASSHAGAISVIAHAVVIGAWVSGTLPSATMPRESLANRVYYIPPPDRPSSPRGTNETVRYFSLLPTTGGGSVPAAIDVQRPITLAPPAADVGQQKVDSIPAQAPIDAGTKDGDSVFTILEVDTAVVRSQSSAAPAYPVDLLAKSIQGMVLARYVVDTTGFADTTSFEVIQSTHAGFVRAVREALPYMRFSPAKIGSLKVRQLVEQPFTFKITPGMAGAPKP